MSADSHSVLPNSAHTAQEIAYAKVYPINANYRYARAVWWCVRFHFTTSSTVVYTGPLHSFEFKWSIKTSKCISFCVTVS